MIYLQLFLSFLQVGMFSVGGGYAAMPLIQSQVVEQHGWLTMQEFTDLITIAEMTPGPIAVNSATFVGLRIAQVPGAIIATLGCITPALFFVSLLSYIYRKYKDISLLQSVLACLRPVIVALIFGAGLSILSMVVFGESAKTLANVDWIGIGSFASAFFVPVRRGRAWTSHFARNIILRQFVCWNHENKSLGLQSGQNCGIYIIRNIALMNVLPFNDV